MCKTPDLGLQQKNLKILAFTMHLKTWHRVATHGTLATAWDLQEPWVYRVYTCIYVHCLQLRLEVLSQTHPYPSLSWPIYLHTHWCTMPPQWSAPHRIVPTGELAAHSLSEDGKPECTTANHRCSLWLRQYTIQNWDHFGLWNIWSAAASST